MYKKLKVYVFVSLVLIIGYVIISHGRHTSGNDSASLNQPDQTEPNLFSEDDIVNKFVVAYNDTYDNKITDIKRGNIRTKYSGNLNGYYINMLNANDAAAELFEVTINNKREESCSEDIYDIYKNVLMILDETLTNIQINYSISDLKRAQSLSQFQLNDNININFVPMLDQPCQAPSRLDIQSKNYK